MSRAPEAGARGSRPARGGGAPRPGRPVLPVVSAPLVLAVGWLVVHDSGSGWVQVIGELVAATLLVGVLGPAVALWRARLGVGSVPPDATAGREVALGLTASTRVRVRPLDPPGPARFVGPGGTAQPPPPSQRPRGPARRAEAATPLRQRAGRVRAKPDAAPGAVTLVPPVRGVCQQVVLEVASAAPWGLQWWARRVVLDLPAPILVAPRRGRPAGLADRPGAMQAGSELLGSTAARADSGELRGVRPYQPGDRPSRAHWPATAHAGELLVRDEERPPGMPWRVQVVLPSDPEAAERVAEDALATVAELLERGSRVLLATSERGREVEGWVSDERGAGRRLALAGPPGAGAPELPFGLAVALTAEA